MEDPKNLDFQGKLIIVFSYYLIKLHRIRTRPSFIPQRTRDKFGSEICVNCLVTLSFRLLMLVRRLRLLFFRYNWLSFFNFLKDCRFKEVYYFRNLFYFWFLLLYLLWILFLEALFYQKIILNLMNSIWFLLILLICTI